MQASYERPFRPIALDEQLVEALPLTALAAQLMSEAAFCNHGRDALTLLHSEELTVVLTVAKRGSVCDEHQQPAPTLLVNLSGSIVISGAAVGEPIVLDAGGAALLAPQVGHVIEARADAAFLTIVGAQPTVD